MRFQVLLLASAFAVSLIRPAHAQTVVPDEPACRACSIAIEPVLTLGDADGPGILPGLPEDVIVDGLGRYWVLPGEGVPLIFDPGGRFLQEVGRRGQGPGEFVFPNVALALPGDSVLVFDYGNMRGTVITPELRHARSVLLPPGQILGAAWVDWPRSVIINSIVRTPEHLGWPLHTVTFADSRTAILRSFGRNAGELRPGFEHELKLTLSGPRAAHVWVAEATRYVLAPWSAEGQRLPTLERDAPWFAGSAGDRPGRGGAPDPIVTGLREDPDGLLWVFILVAAPSWREAFPAPEPGGSRYGEVPMSRIAFEKMYRSVIEVIDTRAARVVARRSYDHPIIAALGDGVAAAYAVRSDAVPVLQILELELQR